MYLPSHACLLAFFILTFSGDVSILGSLTTVYSNIGFNRRPPPLSWLGTGTGGRHFTVVQCIMLHKDSHGGGVMGTCLSPTLDLLPSRLSKGICVAYRLIIICE